MFVNVFKQKYWQLQPLLEKYTKDGASQKCAFLDKYDQMYAILFLISWTKFQANVIPELAIERIIVSSTLSFDDTYTKVFASNEEIYFQTNLNTGNSDIFVLEINGENVTSHSLPIPYNFPLVSLLINFYLSWH